MEWLDAIMIGLGLFAPDPNAPVTDAAARSPRKPSGCLRAVFWCGIVLMLLPLLTCLSCATLGYFAPAPTARFAEGNIEKREAEPRPEVIRKPPKADPEEKGDRVWVKSYTRKDGTKVEGHWRKRNE